MPQSKNYSIPWDDTLLAHHTFASHFPQRLDWVASEYCDAAPWKIKFGRKGQEEKGVAPKDLPGDELCRYNAADCRLTVKSWQRMQGDLSRETKVYEHDKDLARICQGMMFDGIGVDGEKQVELSEALARRAAGLKGEMRRLIRRRKFQPSKLDDVRHALFDTLGARFTMLTSTGLPSTSDAALEALQGDETRAGRFCELLLKWRVVKKIKSTYVDLLGEDCTMTIINPTTKRAHYNWKPFGTVSGRLACRFQSAPKYSPETPEERVRECYIPKEGNEFVYFDVSQAEMRLAAFLSADPQFTKACEGDAHANNAKILFPEIAAKGYLDGDAKKDPKAGKPFRDIAKNIGFAISYCAEADKVFITLNRKGFGVSLRTVYKIMGNLRSAYRVYYRWVAENHEAVKRCGYMRTPFLGRIRWLGWFPAITDVANFPIQSALADIVNQRMIKIGQEELRQIPGTMLVAQIHDACVYDTPRKYVEEMQKILRRIWGEKIRCPGGDLVLPIDLKVADRLSAF